MTTTLERRCLPSEFEVRSLANGKAVIEGYAAKFNVRSQEMYHPRLGNFVEEIRTGAFKRTVDQADVRSLINHDPSLLLGRSKAGTLRLAEDRTGLHYSVDVPDTSYARDLMVSMERGDISQSSFGFRTIKDDLVFDGDVAVRCLQEVALTDVSPVTYPAYEEATAELSVRSYELMAKRLNVEVEAVLSAPDLRALLRGDVPVETSTSDLDPASATPTPDEVRRFFAKREAPEVERAMRWLATRS